MIEEKKLPYEVQAILDLYLADSDYPFWACLGCGGNYPTDIVTACPRCSAAGQKARAPKAQEAV